MTANKGDVELAGSTSAKDKTGGTAYEYDDADAVASATPVPSATLLDPQTVAVLSKMESFFIQQRIRWIEAATGGCVEQANVYDVFDHDTNKRVMIIQEESDGCSRCFCKPNHSVFVRFYHVGSDAPELQPGQNIVDWSYQPSGDPFMTFEREGCDCCFKGLCPKPCLCCFACGEGCKEVGTLHAGNLTGRPGELQGKRERTNLLGASVQPTGGGGFKPVMQLMDRADPSDGPTGKADMFAAVRGPCIFGGCSALCCNAEFDTAVAAPQDEDDIKKIHAYSFGDFATITKIKPKSLTQAAREVFTDSDIFDVQFKTKSITPQQKANVLAQMVHLDYMFFEKDHDMVHCRDSALHIVLFNCFCYGCTCPCEIILKGK